MTMTPDDDVGDESALVRGTHDTVAFLLRGLTGPDPTVGPAAAAAPAAGPAKSPR
jgi:hypothetical protein